MEQHSEKVKRALELLQAVVNGVIAGLQVAFQASLAHIVLVLTNLACVGLGSAIGGTARFFVSGLVGRAIGETFPWGTVVVNVTGAFAIGAAAAAGHSAFEVPTSWHFTVVGVLGTYTTVSSFSLQTLALARDGELVRAGGNIVVSLVVCLSAVALGFFFIAEAMGQGVP